MENPFHIFSRKREYSLTKKILIIIIAVIIGLLVWFLYILNGLRIFIPYYPWLSGLPFQSKNYIIVFQNDAELRPGGGFITAYGVLRFVSGIPVEFSVHDVFSLSEGQTDAIQAPYPIEEMLEGPYFKGWAFQDANWYVDFPTSAKKLIWFYNRTYPRDTIDGVVAVNFGVLEDLLSITGPIKVGDNRFDRNNLFSQLEYEVNNIDRHNIDDLAQRKDILKNFYSAVLSHILWSPIKYQMVTALLEEKLNEKEIQLFYTDSLLANMVARKEWDGALQKPGNGDYLGVVEANLGGMKSDRYMERTVRYNVEINAQNDSSGNRKAVATLTIRFQHHGGYNEPLSYTYKGFVRVLVPEGSMLLSSGDIGIGEESGYTVFGTKLELEPGAEKEITFTYILPARVVHNNQYQLTLNKQSGTNDLYIVRIHAPQDYILEGNKWDVHDNIAVFERTLGKNTILPLLIREDTIPPRVTFQTFKNLQTLEIHFNEPVLSSTCKKENVTVADLNVTYPETDAPVVVDIHCEKSGALISLSGITRQDEEQYGLTLRDVTDLVGNLIDPNPKNITVVQRNI